MMNSNTCAFNAPSRKSLYEKVMKIGMDTEQVLYEDFVTFDKAHLPEMLPVAKLYTCCIFRAVVCPSGMDRKPFVSLVST